MEATKLKESIISIFTIDFCGKTIFEEAIDTLLTLNAQGLLDSQLPYPKRILKIEMITGIMRKIIEECSDEERADRDYSKDFH